MAKLIKNQNKEKEEEEGSKNAVEQNILGGKHEHSKDAVDNTKKAVKKIKKLLRFLRRHPKLAKALLIISLIIVVIIIFTLILYSLGIIDFENSSSSLENLVLSTRYTPSSTGDDDTDSSSSTTRKITGGTIKYRDGEYCYELLYGEDYDYDLHEDDIDYIKNKKIEKINAIKTELAKRDIEIYDNNCLLFIAVMVDNGLDLSQYSKAALESMYMFFKAEIATSSLDLRSEDERNSDENPLENKIVPEGYTYKEENYDENDYLNDRICGTIRVEKLTYDNTTEAKKTLLTYLPFDDFNQMIQNNEIEASKYFTLDEENNLIVAGWSTKQTNVEIEYGECFREDIKDVVESEYIEDGFTSTGTNTLAKGEANAYKYRSIPYLDYVSKYTMPFSFLMSLLVNVGQENAVFCNEIAKIAETSHITITLQEEYSTLTTNEVLEHNDYKKDFGNITAKFSGSVGDVTTSSQRDLTADVNGMNATQILTQYNGVGTRPRTENEGTKVTYYYNWTSRVDNTKSYNLVYEIITTEWSDEISQIKPKYERVARTQRARVVSFIETTTTTQESDEIRESEVQDDLFVEEDGTAITRIGHTVLHIPYNANRLFLRGSITYEEAENLGNYSELKGNQYTVTKTTTTNSNSYKLEITEVDNWYEIYQKTYSEIEEEDIGQPESVFENELETITNKETFDPINNPWGDKAYINSIINNEEAIKKFLTDNAGILDISDLTDIEMEVSKLIEYYLTYGKENIKTWSTGKRYKRAGTEQEIVQIKVQNNNTTAILGLTADAFGVEKLENNSQTTTTGLQKEEAYKTTDQYENSFLKVYDKDEYEFTRNNLESIDEWLYQMLDSRASTKGMANLLRYLLFLYDGTDTGVTEYDVTLFKPEEFTSKKVRGSAIIEWLKSFEYNDLRELRNGTISYERFKTSAYRKESVSQDQDGKLLYHMYHLDYESDVSSDHSWNFSYGLMIHNSKTGKQNLDEALLNEAGLSYSELMADTSKGWDADVIDNLMVIVVNHHRNIIKNYYENKGIVLENNELDAFIAIAYGFGNCQANNDSVELLRRYKEGNATREEVINGFTIGRSHPFIYEDWIKNGRANALQEMFFNGRYILSTGEEIDPNSFGGSLIDWDGETYSNDLYTFPVYNQHTGPWASKLFGGPNGRGEKTISSSGCGCCSLAVILSGYTGEAITPDILTDILDAYYPDGSYYVYGVGSSDAYYSNNSMLGKEFNCRGEACTSFKKAEEALRNGYAVIGAEKGHILAFVPTASADGRFV